MYKYAWIYMVCAHTLACVFVYVFIEFSFNFSYVMKTYTYKSFMFFWCTLKQNVFKNVHDKHVYNDVPFYTVVTRPSSILKMVLKVISTITLRNNQIS